MSEDHAKGYIRNAFAIGSSIGVTLPSWFCKNNKIEAGTAISIIERDNIVELRVVSREQFDYTLRGNNISTNINAGKISNNKKLNKK